jgi:hypothetical protein
MDTMSTVRLNSCVPFERRTVPVNGCRGEGLVVLKSARAMTPVISKAMNMKAVKTILFRFHGLVSE